MLKANSLHCKSSKYLTGISNKPIECHYSRWESHSKHDGIKTYLPWELDLLSEHTLRLCFDLTCKLDNCPSFKLNC